MDKNFLLSTVIGRDFLDFEGKGKMQPTIDNFLDYRYHLKMNLSKKYPYEVEREIIAVDMILHFLNEAKSRSDSEGK